MAVGMKAGIEFIEIDVYRRRVDSTMNVNQT
jgi:hypothetical protein